MRLLLGHSYFMEYDDKQRAKARPYMPLATLHLAAHLRRRGHEVALFDAMLAPGEHAFADALSAEQPQAVVLFEDNFNFLSKMCLSRMRDAALTMVAMCCDAGIPVVVAGSDPSDHPAPYLAAGAAAVALGEGDHTVTEVVERWSASQPIDDVAGLALCDDRQIVRTAPRGNERHPDVFGTPARDLVDVEAYRRVWTAAHGMFSMNMASTRGCPFHCNWCAKPIWGQRYAMRSAVEVAAELDDIAVSHRPDHVWFADDIFGLRSTWLREFADEVERRGTRLAFTIQSRCDLMTEQAVDDLRRAGCHEVWLGAESGSQRILDAMDKGTTIAQIESARHRLAAAGVRASFFIQLGYPGETRDDLMATVDMVTRLLPDDIGVSVSYPLPGTPFHAMVRDQLGTKTHWDDSGDLDMMFRGTYTSTFYRHVHRLLHDDLDLRRREAGLTPCPSQYHPAVSPSEHRARVDAAWEQFHELERSERTARPTLLVRSHPAPAAPDLSEAFN